MLKVGRPHRLDDAEVIIIPMIDTMMFLLMVFIVASLALAVQQGIPVDLPKASTSVAHQAQNVTVTITAQNRIYVNTTPTNVEDVATRLEALKVTDASLVIINADQNVKHGLVVAVMDGARKAGILRFAIATGTS
jgi:biopolymer transport protein ExbD